MKFAKQIISLRLFAFIKFAIFQLLIISIGFSIPTKPIAAADTVSINPWFAKKSTPGLSRVKVVLEVQGIIKNGKPKESSDKDAAANPKNDVNPKNDGNSKNTANSELPMKAIANLTYDEQISQSSKTSESLRYYHEAKTDITVAGRNFHRSLRKERSVISCDLNGIASNFSSASGSLTRNELELITVPANSFHIDRLVPNREVKMNETISHEEDLLARLLDFDAVTGNDASSNVVAIEGDKIRFTIKGRVVGAVDGVVSDVELDGKYNFSIRESRITWLALSIKEDRSTGPTTPGFDVTARIRLVVESNPDESFIQEALDAKSAPLATNLDLLEYAPETSNFRFNHSRNWHLISEIPQRSILRFVKNDETVAQCNLRELPTSKLENIPSLKQFTNEIKKNLKDSAPEIVQSSESTNPTKLRILRAVVVGTVSNTPVQWIYYHATDEQGRGVSFVFTMGVDAAETFAVSDIEITNSLEIIENQSVRQAQKDSRTESIQ